MLAYEDAVIGSKLAGRVDTVTVDVGSIVRRGEALQTIELNLGAQASKPAPSKAAPTPKSKSP